MTRLVLVFLVVLLVGCSHFIPNVPITAPAAYSPARVEADEKACARARTNDESYATCMIARGYSAYFSVGSAIAGQDYANVLVASPRSREPDSIGADFRECKKYAMDKEASGLRQAARLVIGFPPMNEHEGVRQAFRECMDPRGYTVEPWVPERK